MKKLLAVLMLLCGSAMAQHFATLSWTAPPPQTGVTATVYNVYRSDTPGGQVMGTHPMDLSGVTGLSYTDNTVVGGHTYYYKVSMWCAPCNGGKGAESPFSNEYKADFPPDVAIVPGAPTITTVVIK